MNIEIICNVISFRDILILKFYDNELQKHFCSFLNIYISDAKS